MSITDELRKWGYGFCGDTHDVVTAIADRIDAEHGRAMADAYLSGTPTDEKLTELGWIRLPKDADGEYIHVGDVMEWVRYKDDDPTIVRTVSGIGNGVFFAWSDEQGRYAQYKADAYRHHHAPTVEDVLTEFAAKLIERGELTNGAAQTIAEYAAKLQLKEDE